VRALLALSDVVSGGSGLAKVTDRLERFADADRHH
jgi:hypothetical protein